jgi:hypothetical protein
MSNLSTRNKLTYLTQLQHQIVLPLLELAKQSGSIVVGDRCFTLGELQEMADKLKQVKQDYADWIYTGAPKGLQQHQRQLFGD